MLYAFCPPTIWVISLGLVPKIVRGQYREHASKRIRPSKRLELDILLTLMGRCERVLHFMGREVQGR